MTEEINHLPCGFLTVTDAGIIRQINLALLDLLGYDMDELEGQSIRRLLSASGHLFYQTHFFPLLVLHGKIDEFCLSLRTKSGTILPMLINVVRRQRDEDFDSVYTLIPMRQRDLYEEEILRSKKAAEEAMRAREQVQSALEAKQAELLQLNAELEKRVAERTAELVEQQEFLRRVIDTSPHQIFVKDRTGRFTLANRAAAEFYGTTVDRMIGKVVADFNPHAEEVARFVAADEVVLHSGHDVSVSEEAVTDVQGQVRWLQTVKRPLTSSDGTVQHLLGVYTDITARKQAEEQLVHQAFHDTLTGLPNRTLFLDRLERALARSERIKNAVAVLFVDLDNFKVVNDSLGHDAGDTLLKKVTERLCDGVRPGDTVARFGGDEFTLLLDEIGGSREAQAVAERLADTLRAPLALSGQTVFPTASIGIAVSGDKKIPPADLLRDADTAMYHAKTGGKARHLLFDQSMNDQALERLELKADLRRAIEQGELRLHFQPIVDLVSGQIREAEALVRWDHPVRGMILPAKFIPIAEETGLIIPLGNWVLHEACRQVRIWRHQYRLEPPFVVGVNLSSQQLAQSGLLDEVVSALRTNGLPATCLKLEITESVMVTDMEAAAEQLTALQEMGVQIAMDDFGTGYSSMSYLSSLPLRTLKIDRSFVSQLGGSGEEQAIVRAIVTLAKSLGLSVTSEGIETAEQLAYLQSMGCDLGQGYYFSRPVPAEVISQWLAVAEGSGPFRIK